MLPGQVHPPAGLCWCTPFFLTLCASIFAFSTLLPWFDLRQRAGLGHGETSYLVVVSPCQRVYEWNQKKFTLRSALLGDGLSHGSLSVCIPLKGIITRRATQAMEKICETLWSLTSSSSSVRWLVPPQALPAMSPGELEPPTRLFKMHLSSGCCGLTIVVYPKLPLSVFSWQTFVERLAITQLRSVIRGLRALIWIRN